MEKWETFWSLLQYISMWCDKYLCSVNVSSSVLTIGQWLGQCLVVTNNSGDTVQSVLCPHYLLLTNTDQYLLVSPNWVVSTNSVNNFQVRETRDLTHWLFLACKHKEHSKSNQVWEILLQVWQCADNETDCDNLLSKQGNRAQQRNTNTHYPLHSLV